jgi:hypothetical protein
MTSGSRLRPAGAGPIQLHLNVSSQIHPSFRLRQPSSLGQLLDGLAGPAREGQG